MALSFCYIAALSVKQVAQIRLSLMFVVLVTGIVGGYLIGTRLAGSRKLAKSLMSTNLIFFQPFIALFVIWAVHINPQIFYLPAIGGALLLIGTACSWIIFLLFRLRRESRFTMTLAGGLSNLGYTGGAFVCYALLGKRGLALGNIYILLWAPLAYFVFLGWLKFYELRRSRPSVRLSASHFFDLRGIVLVAIITALILNQSRFKPPTFIKQFYIVDVFVYLASFIAFFAIGLNLKISRLKQYMHLYFPLAGIKFLLTPAVALLILWALTLTGRNMPDEARKVVIVMSATPSAILMVTMSNVFNLDIPLASAMWVLNNLLFFIFVAPLLLIILT